MIPTYAIVPTAWRECAQRSFAALLPQVEHLVVVSTSVPIPGLACSSASVISAPASLGKNISAWWNLGLDTAGLIARISGSPVWNALVVNDDCIVAPPSVKILADEMRAEGASMAYPNVYDDRRILHRHAGRVEVATAITGWCFMIRGEDTIRADERLIWWYSDNSWDWECREARGSLLVPGCMIEHLYPGRLTSQSAELSAQTHRDRITFEKIWNGRTPH